MTSARLPLRRLPHRLQPRTTFNRQYAAVGPSKSIQTPRGRSSLVNASIVFTAVVGLSMVAATIGTNKDKRTQALQRLDTSKAARQTPAAITDKAEEAAATLPESSEKSGEDVEKSAEGEQSAYDPVTGEINWDCPCLGGMANGPCGEEFKKAFSCFVHSTDEPKGVDCIEAFKGMQDCFRQHPEHYANEIADDDDEDEIPLNSETDAQSVTTSVADSISDAASSASEKAESLVDSAKSTASSAASSVSSLISKTEDDAHKIVHRGATQQAYSEHNSPSYAVGSDAKGNAGSSDSGKIRNQGGTQKGYTHGHGGHSGTQGGGGSSETTNQTGGQADLLGRNAAKGSKPSGSDAAHQKSLEGVKATRTGENSAGSRQNPGMRG